MSRTFETSFHEQLLYRGENKLKWRKRSVSVGRNNTHEKHLLKVQQSHQARSLWKLKKCKRPEVLELNPLRYAVVRLGVFRKQCDVLGLLPLGNSSLACHYFASDCKEVFANFETKLMACCDAVSFNVEIEAQQSFPDGAAFLHVFQDRICLSKNKGSGFKLLGQWKICSHKQLFAVQGGVMLMTENSDHEQSLLVLKTKSGHDIFSKFIERFQELNLGVPGNVPYDVYYGECDGNFNLEAAAVRHKDNLERLCENYVGVDKLQDKFLSRSDESEVTLEHSTCMGLKYCFPRSNLLLSSTIKSLNLWEKDFCHGEPVDNLSSTTISEGRTQQFSKRNGNVVTSLMPIVSHFKTHEHRISEPAITESSEGTIDKQLIAEEMVSCIHIETGDNYDVEPPPIPERQHNSVVHVHSTSEASRTNCHHSNGIKDKRICTSRENVEKLHTAHNTDNEFITPRSYNFEILQQNRIGELHCDTGDNYVLEPPPIPERQHNFVVDAASDNTGTECQQSNGIKDKRMCTSSENMEKIHTAHYTNNEFNIQMSHSFEIVRQNWIGKLHRHKSESAIIIKTSIKELVQPVQLSSIITRSETHVSNDKAPKCRCLSDLQRSEDICLVKQESFAGDLWKEYHQTRKDIFGTSSCDCLLQSEIASEGCCDKLSTDNKPVLKTKEDLPEGDEQSHYANLPRPSCYLYMNLPDTRKAPEETPLYVNHVFQGSTIKGCYENWQLHCGEDFTNVSKGVEESAPDLPAPPLKPRRPPPRVPARRRSPNQTALQTQHNFQQLPERTKSRTPPPRPYKRRSLLLSSCSDRKSLIKDSSCTPHHNLELQFAVFASKATTGQVWFVRIVMMKHDSNDATFKVVMERETACNYHLLQTQPLNISSDIVVSLQHQCKLFELRTEDSQEIDFSVIKNLTPGFWFVIEFHLQHMGTERENFVGSICVEPKDFPVGEKCPVNRKINLGITEEFKLKEPCNCSHFQDLFNNSEGHWGNQHTVIADYKQRKTVCQKLDGTLYSQHNWRDVAGLLGFSVSEIHQLEDKSLRSVFFSPMDNVLSIWEQRDPECSLERLVSILHQIQRFDVVEELGFANN